MLWMFYKASGFSKVVIVVSLAWLALQTAISLSGFYVASAGGPPRIVFLLLPPVGLIFTLFFVGRGRRFLDGLDLRVLTLLHIIRIPVELVLYWLYLYKAVPQAMTFEGRNFDILSGLTAPLVWYFGFVKPVLGKWVLIGWNVVCMLLLVNIAVTAVLSAPSPFQQFGFEQPNIALFYFPFVWLPCCLVPTVLLANVVAIRRLGKVGVVAG